MRYKAIVAYDGTNYSGWQCQLNAPSIQSEIESALATIVGSHQTIVASGRTDGGVHAFGQVFHFDCDKLIEDEHFTRAMNSILPKDIRLQSILPVSDEFHARFDATMKRYDYLITTSRNNPIYQRYMMIDRIPLDVDYMIECTEVFVGEHDFTSFTSNKIDPRKSRVRNIKSITITKEDDYVRISFVGNGFLRYMVRMLSQVLIEAGKHKLSKEDLMVMLEAKDKHVNRYKADSCGLYLMEVSYGGEL